MSSCTSNAFREAVSNFFKNGLNVAPYIYLKEKYNIRVNNIVH